MTEETPAAKSDVLVTRQGAVGIVTINRPSRMNAVTPSSGERLAAAFLDLEADAEIRAIILTGAGDRGFCTGADISGDMGNARDVLSDTWNPLLQTMLRLEVPMIAALNGVAAGAGVSLALACDLRVAAPKAKLALTFAKVGLIPDTGLTWLLPRLVGLGRANELALLGRSLSATEAYQWGLVNQVSEEGAVLDDALAMATTIAEMSSSVSTIKQAHHRALESDLASQLDFEADKQGWLQEQPDFADATKAFNEKRAPVRAPRTPPRR